MRSEVSPHLPSKGKGPEEKTRRRKGVISLAQVGGGVLQASSSTHFIMLILVRMKASYLGEDPVKCVTDRNNIVFCYVCIREHFYLSILGVCMNIE